MLAICRPHLVGYIWLHFACAREGEGKRERERERERESVKEEERERQSDKRVTQRDKEGDRQMKSGREE